MGKGSLGARRTEGALGVRRARRPLGARRAKGYVVPVRVVLDFVDEFVSMSVFFSVSVTSVSVISVILGGSRTRWVMANKTKITN